MAESTFPIVLNLNLLLFYPWELFYHIKVVVALNDLKFLKFCNKHQSLNFYIALNCLLGEKMAVCTQI